MDVPLKLIKHLQLYDNLKKKKKKKKISTETQISNPTGLSL